MALGNVLAKMSVLISGGVDASFGKSLQQGSQEMGKFSKSALAVQDQLKGLVGTLSFAVITKQIIDVTSNFQKFEAVLTNTLGSNSEAQKALTRIKDFAAKTPFSVEELTSSFVKLANQGFQPTSDEMRKLGDVAASTGKTFDQLTEAVIDAQTGEFERLKEFGIRASKQGDQVKFTFKGVQTQVKFTSEEIQKYILSLGDLEGVSGSMAAISETLGGKISNLGDAFDNLLLTIGESTSGPLNAVVESLTQITKVASNLGAELELRAASYGIKNFKDLSKAAQEYALSTARLNGDKLVSEIIEPFEKIGNSQLIPNATGYMQAFLTLLQKEGASIEEATFLWNAYLAKRKEAAAQEEADANAAKQREADRKLREAQEQAAYLASLGIIQKIEIQLKKLEEQKKKSFSTNEIAEYNAQIDKLREELDLLNASRPLSGASTTIQNPRNQRPPISGLEFLADTNANTDFAGQMIVKAPEAEAALNSLMETYIKTGQASKDLSEAQLIRWDQQIAKQKELANTAQQVGGILGDAFSDVISGQKTMLEAVKQVTGQLIQLFLQRALAGMIASAATSGGPPPVAIALAAAGVAAIGALFSSAIGGAGGSVSGASGGGGRSVGATATGNANRSTVYGGLQSVYIEGFMTVKGNDLVYVYDKNKGLDASRKN